MTNRHEAELRATSNLSMGHPEDISDELYFDIRNLGYRLPMSHADYAQDLIRRLSYVASREHLFRSYIPGQRLALTLRMATNLAETALIQQDPLTAFSSARFHDSIHPIDKFRGWERLSDRVVWAASSAIFSNIDVDMEKFPDIITEVIDK